MSDRVRELLGNLTTEEKALLTAGADVWTTAAIERVGVRALGMSDGPNGARGPTLSTAGGGPTLCVPCGTALAATWDPALVAGIGAAVGADARAKGVQLLLAPTVNLHRSPLAGRNFECYSEDPLLSGTLAAGFIGGLQAQGVGAVVKHFVANEAETARMLLDSVVDERTLRELYLVPFELAVEAGAYAIMTGYNRLNGTWCSEHPELLTDILRGEWGFDGLVMTDWWAVGSTAGSLHAGLDLQMPGPGRFFGAPVADAIAAGTVDQADLDRAAGALLRTLARVDAAPDPAPVDGPARAREAAAAGMVLLRNDGTLPLQGVASVAVLGPNAARAQIMGGGSSAVSPQHRTTPLAALRAALPEALPDVAIAYEPGCLIDRKVPALEAGALSAPDGTPGLAVGFHLGDLLAGTAEPTAVTSRAESTRLLYLGRPDPALPETGWSLRAEGRFVPEVDGPHLVHLSQVGRSRVWLDGELVLDASTAPVGGGEDFFGLSSPPLEATVPLTAGTPVELRLELVAGDLPLHGIHLGVAPPRPDDLLGRAVALAAASDVAVVVVGTTDEWESEGFDRTALALPGEQDELIRRVAAANPRTVVVLNCGAPVTMPWRDDVAAVLAVWFGGQEMAPALADVLTGAVDPGGRLPTSLPLALAHTPAFGNFPGADSQVRYGEGLLLGYRWYDTRELPVAYPFGHGLSYASFRLDPPRLSAPSWRPGEALQVTVTVTNTSARTGSEVVQLYVAPPPGAAFRPRRELKAFAKVTLEPGEVCDVTLELTDRAFAYWDPGNPEHEALAARIAQAGAFGVDGRTRPAGWRTEPGAYELHVGRSIADLPHRVALQVERA